MEKCRNSERENGKCCRLATRMDLQRDTPKEAKLHGRQCPLDASLWFSFVGFTSDASQTRLLATVIHPFRAGNLALDIKTALPAFQQNERIISYYIQEYQERSWVCTFVECGSVEMLPMVNFNIQLVRSSPVNGKHGNNIDN